MGSTYSRDSGVPVEYLVFELGLREALGRKMADTVLGPKCCDTVAELPEDLPELEKITGYLQMAQEKTFPDSKLVKSAIRVGKTVLHKLSKAADPVEKLLPDAEHVLAVTGELYKAHRSVIYKLREEYGTRYAPNKILEAPDEQAEDGQDGNEGQLIFRTLLKNAMDSKKKKKKGEELELAKDLQVKIGNRYFEELTSLVEKDTLLDYVSTVFKGVRTASALMQLPPEEMTWLEKQLLKKGESTAKGMIEQLLYIYTSDSALVASFIESVLGLFNIQDPDVVEEGIAWFEGGITHFVTSLYEE